MLEFEFHVSGYGGGGFVTYADTLEEAIEAIGISWCDVTKVVIRVAEELSP